MRRFNRGLIAACAFTFVAQAAYAQKAIGVEDKTVASTFKMLATAFVAVSNTDQIRDDTVKRLRAIDESAYQARYGKVLRAIALLPADVKGSYGLSERMTRSHAADTFAQWNKKKFMSFIEAIPDEVVAGQFRYYLGKLKQESESGDIMVLVRQFWSKTLNLFTKD